MKKTKRNEKYNPDPYEDVVRLEKLDPYEALITTQELQKQNNKFIVLF